MICLVLALFVGISLGAHIESESSSRTLDYPQPPPPPSYPGVCQPNCAGKQCGDNGCNGTCGSCSGSYQVCREGSCVCQPNCGYKICGSDGCGGSCGSCNYDQTCNSDGACVCKPNCDGKTCGSDGCGGSCGNCYNGQDCQGNTCVTTTTACQANCGSYLSRKTCGADGCGGTCGSCSYDQTCTSSGTCVTTTTACQANCGGYLNRKTCGSDGCGGSCGTCSGYASVCTNGNCVTPTTTPVCKPDCGGYLTRKNCGSDGCGGSCGTCSNYASVCSNGVCVVPTTTPANTYTSANWECISGIDVPLSQNQAGDVQCMSTNAHDCLWYGSCAPKLTTGNLQPLVCGTMHKSIYGITGYDSTSHWCYKGKQYFTTKYGGGEGGGWQCLDGISTPVGINSSGDIQCMSLNAKDCMWGDYPSCQNKLNTQNVKPLVCGAAHQALYGITGYDTPTHWCYKSRAILQPGRSQAQYQPRY